MVANLPVWHVFFLFFGLYRFFIHRPNDNLEKLSRVLDSIPIHALYCAHYLGYRSGTVPDGPKIRER